MKFYGLKTAMTSIDTTITEHDSELKMGSKTSGEGPIKYSVVATADVMNPLALNHHGFNMHTILSAGLQKKYLAEGMQMIEPMQLFNIMMRFDANNYPAISNPNYLLLLDARRRETYDESHIALARFSLRTHGQYELPVGTEVETKQHIVIYDDMTELLRLDDGKRIRTDATKLATALYSGGARHAVKVLRGGFILFSRLYPFLRTCNIVYLPKELDSFLCYPRTIITQKLYLGTRDQSSNGKIPQDLKLTAFINCCGDGKDVTLLTPADLIGQHHSLFYQKTNKTIDKEEAVTLHLSKIHHDDWNTCLKDIYRLVEFIDDNAAVMVYDQTGLDEAVTVCCAYMMYKTNSSLQRILKYFQEYEMYTVPNEKAMACLCKLETIMLDTAE